MNLNAANDLRAVVQVVTVTHNSSRLMAQFLECVGPYAQTLTVVDSGSTQDELSATREFCKVNSVDFLELGSNVGFGTATNSGSERSTSKWICVVNPDVSFDASAVSDLVAWADATGSACAGPTIASSDAGLEVGLRPMPGALRRAISRDQKSATGSAMPTASTISGCFMVIRRDAFTQVQGFDERFFMFCEEIDLHARLQQSGGLISQFSGVTVATAGGGSSAGTTSRWSATERQIAHCQLYLKWLGPVAFILDVVYRGAIIAGQGRYAPHRESLSQFMSGVRRVWRKRRLAPAPPAA